MNYPMAGIDSLGLPIESTMSEGRNYTILPASAVNPRNVSSEPFAHPPPFMPTVREMHERYVARMGNIDNVSQNNKDASKKIVQKWKTENKNIYRTKVVCEFLLFFPCN